jgi:hypothetical protein
MKLYADYYTFFPDNCNLIVMDKILHPKINKWLKVTWVTEVIVMCYSGVYMLSQKAKAGGTMELF